MVYVAVEPQTQKENSSQRAKQMPQTANVHRRLHFIEGLLTRYKFQM